MTKLLCILVVLWGLTDSNRFFVVNTYRSLEACEEAAKLLVHSVGFCFPASIDPRG